MAAEPPTTNTEGSQPAPYKDMPLPDLPYDVKFQTGDSIAGKKLETYLKVCIAYLEHHPEGFRRTDVNQWYKIITGDMAGDLKTMITKNGHIFVRSCGRSIKAFSGWVMAGRRNKEGRGNKEGFSSPKWVPNGRCPCKCKTYKVITQLSPPGAEPPPPPPPEAPPPSPPVTNLLGLPVVNMDEDLLLDSRKFRRDIRHIPSDKKSPNRGTPRPNKARSAAKQAPVQTAISKPKNRQATAKPAKPAQRPARPPAPPPKEPVRTIFELLFEYFAPFYSDAEIYNFLVEWDGPSPEYSDEEIAMLLPLERSLLPLKLRVESASA